MPKLPLIAFFFLWCFSGGNLEALSKNIRKLDFYGISLEIQGRPQSTLEQASRTSGSAYYLLHCFQKQSHYCNITVLFNLALLNFFYLRNYPVQC